MFQSGLIAPDIYEVVDKSRVRFLPFCRESRVLEWKGSKGGNYTVCILHSRRRDLCRFLPMLLISRHIVDRVTFALMSSPVDDIQPDQLCRLSDLDRIGSGSVNRPEDTGHLIYREGNLTRGLELSRWGHIFQDFSWIEAFPVESR
jgi:hypothetical protein